MATYCPNCSGNLLYSPSRHAMYCRMCGGTFAPEEVGESERSSTTYECNIYSCPSCGGTIAVTGTEVSTSCVYCGNTTIIFDRISTHQKPDGLIPFSITQKEAVKIVEKHMAGAALLPKDVDDVKIENMKGIYIPYWVVSGKFYDSMTLYDEVVNSGSDSSHPRYYGRAGYCDVLNVPVEAVSSINDKFSNKIEPFNIDDVVEFDEDYLMGFYSDIPDVTADDLSDAVGKKADEMFGNLMCETLYGQKKHVLQSKHWTKLYDDNLMLFFPVWFYTFVYKDKPYTLLINGQTGKIAGTLPWKKRSLKRDGVILASLMSILLIAPFVIFDWLVTLESTTTIVVIGFFLTLVFWLIGFITSLSVKENAEMTQEGSVFDFVNERKG